MGTLGPPLPELLAEPKLRGQAGPAVTSLGSKVLWGGPGTHAGLPRTKVSILPEGSPLPGSGMGVGGVIKELPVPQFVPTLSLKELFEGTGDCTLLFSTHPCLVFLGLV